VITNIETTAVTSVASVADAGRTVTASCLLGAGSSLSHASVLRGTGSFAGTGVVGGVAKRPTWAPVAPVAHIPGYAFAAANGAEDKALLANGNEAAVDQQLSMKRAFRGLEPWRDPA
jgi:hypothetical protein